MSFTPFFENFTCPKVQLEGSVPQNNFQIG